VILLDSNVLLYATGGAHPLREPSRALLSAIAHGKVTAHLTDILLTEFLHVRARRVGRSAAAQMARDFVDAVTSVLPVTDQCRIRAISLFESASRIGSNDALIAAVALENGLALVSADQDFREVAGLQLIPPDSPRAAALAAG
jgi:uncharacterized protein